MHGDDVEFQCVNDGGLFQVCLRLSKVFCSVVKNWCREVTPEVRKMMRKRRRCGGGILCFPVVV